MGLALASNAINAQRKIIEHSEFSDIFGNSPGFLNTITKVHDTFKTENHSLILLDFPVGVQSIS